MKAFYNEIDRFNCDLLSNLMDADLITPGKIDDRSIVDVRPDDVAGYERVHFFAGIGGWDLALNIAGWSRPVWTGSCPCQPFSLAGKQRGFADERHLWPVWRDNLIRVGRPPTIFGEQVASASDWLRLVRGDLEALEYAVGAIPIEAASAGADHLRDRYWFVGHAVGEGQLQQEGPQRALWRWASDASDLGNAGSSRLAIGSVAEIQRGDVRQEGPAVATAGFGGMGVADPGSDGARRRSAGSFETQGATERKHWRTSRTSFAPGVDGETEWVFGADGKARRVKSGIRLLADGFPNRVDILRGFGNAIDPRPAAAFIRAAS